MGRAWTLTVCLLLAAATVAVYAPVIGHDFVSYDDDTYVTSNAHVQAGLRWDTVRWAWTTGHSGYWHPLTWMSLALDVEMYGVRAPGFHLSNLLFHVLNTLLLFGILKRTTCRIGPAACVAGLFALHPLHVESVAWVAERKDVLSAALGLISIAAYVSYARRLSGVRYALTFCLLALGLCTKPMLVTLPCVYLLLDYWPLQRKNKSVPFLLLEKLPFMALAALLSIVTYLSQATILDTIPYRYPQVALPLRIANAAVSYVRYIAKMFWPVDLSILYPHPYALGGAPWSAWTVAASTALLGGLCVLLLWTVRHRYAAIGWLWYLGMLVPAIGVVQSGIQAMADRYTYLPLVGLFVIVAWGCGDLAAHFAARRPWAHRAAPIAAVTALAVCAVVSRRQVHHWRDSVALYEHAVQVSRNNSVMLYNLAMTLHDLGRIEEAIERYRWAAAIDPLDVSTHTNLAHALRSLGRLDEAIHHFRRALAISPHIALTHNNLASALLSNGEQEQAIHHLVAATRMAPDNAVFHMNLSIAYADALQFDRAAATATAALRLATKAGSTALAERIRKRLSEYEQQSAVERR